MSLFDYTHSPMNVLGHADEELQRFYVKIRKEFLKMQSEFKGKITSKSKKKRKHLSKLKSTVPVSLEELLSNPEYLLEYIPGHVPAVTNHLLRMVKENPLIFRNALWSRQINICCLGGGPASDVIGISRILSSAQELFWQASRRPLLLQITIVDQWQEWGKIAEKVLETLQSTPYFFDAVKMELSFRFICADLLQHMNDEVKMAIREADLVTMVKLISVVKPKAQSFGISRLMQDIAINMKADAILFYLDTGMNQQWRLLDNSLSHFTDVKRTYGPYELEPFTTDIDYFYRCVKNSQKNVFIYSYIINACAWVKSNQAPFEEIGDYKKFITHSRKARVQQLLKINLQRREKLLQCQNALDKFNRKVKKILLNKNKQNNESEFEEETNQRDKSCPDYLKVREKELFSSKPKSRRIGLEL